MPEDKSIPTPYQGFDSYKSPETGSLSEGHLSARNNILKYANTPLDRALVMLTFDFLNHLENRGAFKPMPWEYLDYIKPNDPSFQFYRVVDHINEQTTGQRLRDTDDHLQIPLDKFEISEALVTDFFRNTKYGQEKLGTLEIIKELISKVGADNKTTSPKEALAELMLIRFVTRAMLDNHTPERDVKLYFHGLFQLTKEEIIVELMSRLNSELSPKTKLT